MHQEGALAKIIAVKTMAIQAWIAPGTCLLFGSLCFESNELGELIRREFKQDTSDTDSVTMSVISEDPVYEIGYESDYGTASVGSGASAFGSTPRLQTGRNIDLDYCGRFNDDLTSATDQFREVFMIRCGANNGG